MAVLGAVLATLVALLPLGAVQPTARAAEAPEASDIVLVLDFSGSILTDEETRTAFADALDRIAARAEETADTLVAGDVTVSIVIFATTAVDVPNCTGLAFRESQAAVEAFAACLREVASTYRNGGSPELVANIGDDTNYVDAMAQAGDHLPADSVRPAIIFFTDGRHEADEVPVSEVLPARDELFGDRSPFGLLPVGMGVDPDDRATLEAGLVDLRITRDLERCEGGPLEWPNVVFDTAEGAGQAVALALQDVSCTFTVEPSPTPSLPPTPPPPTPTPTPEPTPAAAGVRSIRLVPGDSVVELTWREPEDAATAPVEGYQARCRPRDGGDWIESVDGVTTEMSATVEGLANGVQYICEVAAIRASGPGAWTPASGAVAPFGAPPPPTKPTVEALDGAARVAVTMPGDAPVTALGYECSADGGTTWSVRRDVSGTQRVVDIAGLANGTEYVCRAIASNESGASDPSPVSDVFRPCSGLLDCNPTLLPWLGLFAFLLLALILVALWRWYAGRRVYVTASVDGFPSITLGRGPNVGLRFVTRGPYRRMAGAEPARGRDADVHIGFKGGIAFELRAGRARVRTEAGRIVQMPDAQGTTHSVVLGAFDEEPQPLRREEE